MSQQDPFYTITHSIGATQPMPYAHVPLNQQINEQSLQAVREIVREEVQKAMVEMINKIKAQTGARF